MGQFKRARLRGSDELFRPTAGGAEGAGGADAPEAAGAAGAAGALDPPAEAATGGLAVELSAEEVRAIVDALELARFPERQRPRLLSQEFERLRELQDRLRRLLPE